MNRKRFTVAILGCGNRGAESYGMLFYSQKNKFEIVSLCDSNPEKRKKYAQRFCVSQENVFAREEEFFTEKRADLLVIATMDADHVRQCIAGLKLGYDILLEKPITDRKEECAELLEAQRKYGGKVLVCHVLRYAPAYIKAAEILSSGAIGRLVSIQAIEQVAYWHIAHSYVRGNWRRREETAPMILTKCCHDLDLLQYYAKSRCKSISSVGDLAYFTAENAPEGAAARCTECALSRTCPYSALRIYADTWNAQGRPESVWPHNQITTAYPLTEEAILEALKNGPYGRCVYACDNDVVDHQLTQITFENGVKASLAMMGFTAECGRLIRFFGTLGELELNESEDKIVLRPFGKQSQTTALSPFIEGGHGHGGGDNGLVQKLYDVLCGNVENETSLEASVESHYMAICAEESRLQGGKLIYVHGDDGCRSKRKDA